MKSPLQTYEANFAGAAKYRKVCRLAGDRNDENDNELPNQTSENKEEDKNDPNYEHKQFDEDNPDWKWVVGMYHGACHVRFVRTPNRNSTTFLMTCAG